MNRQWKDGTLPCKGQSIVIPEEVVMVPKTFIFGPETILPNNGMLLFDQSGKSWILLLKIMTKIINFFITQITGNYPLVNTTDSINAGKLQKYS